jgi:flagellar basal body-associated protein FliL
MDHSQRIELEAKLRQTLKDHQHEGLHMVGGADQLIARLVDTVEEWLQHDLKIVRKSA